MRCHVEFVGSYITTITFKNHIKIIPIFTYFPNNITHRSLVSHFEMHFFFLCGNLLKVMDLEWGLGSCKSKS